ncbi:MAG: rubrerythrin [Planctomycetota bacterium]|mgnify:CR=1 FL=1
MDLKGSQTEKNLLKAFAGESQARNRYSYFAKKAKKDGFEQIAAVFEETAEHERAHAKRFFKFLKGGEVEITAVFPAGVIGTTAENLKAAAGGEHFEWEKLYPSFARTARDEGFMSAAEVFESIAVAERHHEGRYLSLLKHVEAGTVFKRNSKVIWHCRKCGYTHEGTEAPPVCKACAHPQAYFEVLSENF